VIVSAVCSLPLISSDYQLQLLYFFSSSFFFFLQTGVSVCVKCGSHFLVGGMGVMERLQLDMRMLFVFRTFATFLLPSKADVFGVSGGKIL